MSRPPKSQVAGVVKSLRLTPDEWAELKRRGGADYLRRLLANDNNAGA